MKSKKLAIYIFGGSIDAAEAPRDVFFDASVGASSASNANCLARGGGFHLSENVDLQTRVGLSNLSKFAARVHD